MNCAITNAVAPSTGGAPASYRITPYVGTTAGTPVTVPATSTSKTITGLTGGTTYTFVVTAINGAPVDSLARGQQIVESLRSAASARVTVLRDGKPTDVTIALK